MKKIYLPLLGLTILLPMHASATVICGPKPMCEDYGYIHNGCPGNFVACPFDANFKTCDEEAYQNDFKFALASGNADNRGDWEKANTSGSVYENAFIVGRGGTGYTRNPSSGLMVQTYDKGIGDLDYCMPVTTTVGTKPVSAGTAASATIPSHKHTDMSFISVNPLSTSFKSKTATGIGNSNLDGVLTQANWVDQTLTVVKNNDLNRTYPEHYRVDGYFYTYTPGKWNTGQVALPTSKPDCDNLGYKDSVSNCPGDYVVCPFDNAKVMCDMEAKAGEIKFSLQTADHDGWLLCDGRKLSEVTVNDETAENSELSDILMSAGFHATQYNPFKAVSRLPDYSDVFLALRSSEDVFDYPKYEELASHTHSVNYTSRPKIFSTATVAETFYINSNTDDYWGFGCNYDDSSQIETSDIISGTTSCTSSAGCTNTSSGDAPFHYKANIFIYTGKL